MLHCALTSAPKYALPSILLTKLRAMTNLSFLGFQGEIPSQFPHIILVSFSSFFYKVVAVNPYMFYMMPVGPMTTTNKSTMSVFVTIIRITVINN